MSPRTLAEEEADLNDDRRLSAIARTQPERIAHIKQLHKGGMSRRTLIVHFGQDVVDLALAGG